MNRQKLCALYDSSAPATGDVYNIVVATQMNGWKELSFTLPYHVDGAINWREPFICAEYLVKFASGDQTDWYILDAPKQTHKGGVITLDVNCSHLSS
jgi:hypothetical protein